MAQSKLIANGAELDSEFQRLMKEHKEFHWATAWAGLPPSLPFLRNMAHKIKKIVVGLHFHQTHPDFMREFIKNRSIRYVMKFDGVFHPKLYLFYSSDSNWEFLIGSANYTNAAFTGNFEVCVLISNRGAPAPELLGQARSVIAEAWQRSSLLTAAFLESYSKAYETQRPRDNLKRTKRRRVPPLLRNRRDGYRAELAHLHWPDFLRLIQRSQLADQIPERINLLSEIRDYFSRGVSFRQFALAERQLVAGTVKRGELFGNMQRAIGFATAINNNNRMLSDALDAIPATGPVTMRNYDLFRVRFERAQANVERPISRATRLLAMKRPDVFLCVSARNAEKLCAHLDVPRSHITLDRYWPDIISPILISEWWNSPKPGQSMPAEIWKARVAMLDVVYYSGR